MTACTHERNWPLLQCERVALLQRGAAMLRLRGVHTWVLVPARGQSTSNRENRSATYAVRANVDAG